MKAMTCSEVLEEYGMFATNTTGRWRRAYVEAMRVCRQHMAHKARAIRKLTGLATACGKKPIGDVYAIAARWLTGTPSD